MNDASRRVLLITRNLPPVIGGMERLIGHVAEMLVTHYETAIVGPLGARLEYRPLAYYGCPLSPPARFLAAAARHAKRAAKHHRPDLVFAGSGLVAPIARSTARKTGARYAVYLHGLDIAARHPLYRRLFIPAIRCADLALANSRYTARLAIAAGTSEARIRILHPGAAIPSALPDRQAAAADFRMRHRLPPGPILLGLGRLTPRKGFADFVAYCLPAVLETFPDAQFVVAGEVPRHAAKRGGDEAETIRRTAAAAGIVDRVHLIGPLDDAGLALAWPAADVHVFPVRDDPRDPEGFGMVALEAAAWGVPTVAFAAGGVPDAVEEGESGHLIRPGDYVGFASRVIDAARRRTEMERGARTFAERFAWPVFESRLLDILKAG